MDGCWALENISSEWCRAEEGVALLEAGFESEGSILLQANAIDCPDSGVYSGAYAVSLCQLRKKILVKSWQYVVDQEVAITFMAYMFKCQVDDVEDCN